MSHMVNIVLTCPLTTIYTMATFISIHRVKLNTEKPLLANKIIFGPPPSSFGHFFCILKCDIALELVDYTYDSYDICCDK